MSPSCTEEYRTSKTVCSQGLPLGEAVINCLWCTLVSPNFIFLLPSPEKPWCPEGSRDQTVHDLKSSWLLPVPGKTTSPCFSFSVAQSRLKPMLFLLQALMCWNDSLGYNTLLKAVTSIPLIYFVNMVQRLEHSLLGLVLSFHHLGFRGSNSGCQACH